MQNKSLLVSFGDFATAGTSPRDQGPFQELAMFPPRQPASKLKSKVVFFQPQKVSAPGCSTLQWTSKTFCVGAAVQP